MTTSVPPPIGMALQLANSVAITGGTIDGTAIGNTKPSTVNASTLVVAGTATFSNTASFSGLLSTSNGIFVYDTNTGGFGNGWGTTDLTIGSAGTSGPGSGRLALRYDSTSNCAYIGVVAPSYAWQPLIIQIGTFSVLSQGGVKGIYQDINANVGIGTVNPAYNLDVTGVARITQSLTIGNTSPASANSYNLIVSGNSYLGNLTISGITTFGNTASFSSQAVFSGGSTNGIKINGLSNSVTQLFDDGNGHLETQNQPLWLNGDYATDIYLAYGGGSIHAGTSNSYFTINSTLILGNVLSTAYGGTGANSLTNALDAAFGNTVGNILVRGNSGWTVVPPGSNGQVLTISGTSPTYTTPASVNTQAFILQSMM